MSDSSSKSRYVLAALFGSQGLVVVTGLASGRIRPTGFWFLAVLLLLAVYVFGLIAVGACGISLMRALFKKTTARGDTA